MSNYKQRVKAYFFHLENVTGQYLIKKLLINNLNNKSCNRETVVVGEFQTISAVHNNLNTFFLYSLFIGIDSDSLQDIIYLLRTSICATTSSLLG